MEFLTNSLKEVYIWKDQKVPHTLRDGKSGAARRKKKFKCAITVGGP